jgi:hypothetical protein
MNCKYDIDAWLMSDNCERPDSGKHCYSKTPMQTFKDSLHIAKNKNISNIERISDNLMISYQAASLLSTLRLSHD